MKVLRIEEILKVQQPKEYDKLRSKRNHRREKENLSFSDVEELMKHDSYKRHKGALRQR